MLIVKNSDEVLIQIKHAKHFLFSISQLAYTVLHHHSSHLLLDFSSENDRFLHHQTIRSRLSNNSIKMYTLRKTITKIWGIISSTIIPRNNHTKLTVNKSKDLTVIFACIHYLINIKSKGFTLNSKVICKKLLATLFYHDQDWLQSTLIWLLKRPNKIAFLNHICSELINTTILFFFISFVILERKIQIWNHKLLLSSSLFSIIKSILYYSYMVN